MEVFYTTWQNVMYDSCRDLWPEHRLLTTKPLGKVVGEVAKTLQSLAIFFPLSTSAHPPDSKPPSRRWLKQTIASLRYKYIYLFIYNIYVYNYIYCIYIYVVKCMTSVEKTLAAISVPNFPTSFQHSSDSTTPSQWNIHFRPETAEESPQRILSWPYNFPIRQHAPWPNDLPGGPSHSRFARWLVGTRVVSNLRNVVWVACSGGCFLPSEIHEKSKEVRPKTCSLFCVTFCQESSKTGISQKQRSAVSHPSQRSPFTTHLQQQIKNKPRSCHSAIFPPSSVVSADFPPFLRSAASAPPLSGHGIHHHHSRALRNDYSGSESNDGSISIDAWATAASTPQTLKCWKNTIAFTSSEDM